MGVGKSTIGRVLADIMNLRFLDSDQEIESITGADIPWIFDVEGESGFRERERKMIRQLCKRQDIVLATGGGVILENIDDGKGHPKNVSARRVILGMG